MKYSKGFTLIEVLVSSIILFLSIIVVSMAYKQYESFTIKQRKYENIYISALSLMNKLENENLKEIDRLSGTINGLSYAIKIEKIAAKRNYVYDYEFKKSGNHGKFLVRLYRITLNIGGKKFILYKTDYISS